MNYHYPLMDYHTGRPQFVNNKNDVINGILDNHVMLVNTSYNCHGKPIVYSGQDALDDFYFQLEHCDDPKRMKLLIGDY